MPNIVTYIWFYRLLSVLFVLMYSVSTRAQDEKLRALIDEGEIEDTVGEVNLNVTSSSYSVIKANRFRHSFVSLPDVIEQEVGVQVRQSGGVGSLSTVVLRGASNEQVVIYLDGIPLNAAVGGPVDLSLIPLNDVERIEVYRGSTPLELGNPSIGGAVNIITRQSDKVIEKDAINTQLSATAASFHTYKLAGSSSIVKDKNRFYVGTSYLKSKNDFSYSNNNGTPANLSDDRVEKRNNDGVEHLTVLANWKHKVNARLDTELRLNVSDRNKELPSAINSSASEAFVDTQDYNLLGQVNIRSYDDKDINLNFKFFVSQKDEVFDDSLAQAGFFNQRTDSVTKKTGTQIYVEFKKPEQHWKLLSGLSQETYDTTSSLAIVQSDKNTRNKFEASAESVSFFDEQRFILSTILRYESLQDEIATTTDEFGNVAAGFEKTYQYISPQFGLKYRVDNQIFLTANVGQYNRAPSFLELFGGEGLLLGNPDLEQEKSINTDLGYTYTWFKPYHWLHDAELYGGLFYNQVDDLIVRIYNGQGVGVPRNISDATIQGVEATFKFLPTEKHTINANVSLIDSVNDSDVVAFKDKKLPGYYRKSLLMRYAYANKNWLYSLEADIKRDVFFDRANLLKGDDIDLINAGIRYLMKKSNIDFRVNNIRDENFQYFRNRPTPGLNVSLTFNHTF